MYGGGTSPRGAQAVADRLAGLPSRAARPDAEAGPLPGRCQGKLGGMPGAMRSGAGAWLIFADGPAGLAMMTSPCRRLRAARLIPAIPSIERRL